MRPFLQPPGLRNPWPFRIAAWSCSLAVLLANSFGAVQYHDYAGLTERLKKLAVEQSDCVRLKAQTTTIGKRELWLVELGFGTDEERQKRPALLVVAGIEGNDLAGSASAVEWIHNLAARHAKEPAIHSLLERTTIYVFPRVNPDAAESFFTRPRVERLTNLTPTDDDHDGLVDEDGPEDLNGDGLVSSMRVEDPEGDYIADTIEPRLLIKADKSKGERGAWKLLSEGVDNDKDEQWNEDDLGGVNLNRNFPYRYAYFAPDAGWHQVSEPESRALADFVVSHPNIGIAFTFGSVDNLVQAPKSEPEGKHPPGAISEPDAPYLRELGQAYRSAIGLRKELTASSETGTLSDWIYFHRGRMSLAARTWSPQLELETRKAKPEEEPAKSADAKDSDKPDKSDNKPDKPKEDKKPPADKRAEEDRAALKWFDENAPEGFIPWKPISHPDFPNQRVEVGGWAPFARTNPPEKLLEDWTQRHAKFLTELAGKLPRIGLRKAEAKHLGNGVYELIVQVENTGYLPTSLAQGALTREVLRTRVALKLEDKQILAGERISLLGPIAGSGGMDELRYVIQASGAVQVEVTSALGGILRQSIELKEKP